MRARGLPHPGQLPDRADHAAAHRDRRHRAAVRGGAGKGHRAHQGPGAGQEAHRDHRRQGPHRPAPRAAARHRDPQRLPPRGSAGRAVPADADGRNVRHQQRRAGRRAAPRARPAGAAQHLRRPPHRGRPAAQRVPAAQARGPAASGRRPDDRAAGHRRGHRGHPVQRRLRGRQAAADGSVRPVRHPGAVHPGHAAAAAHPLRPAGAGAGAGHAAARDRRADRDPVLRRQASRDGLRGAGRRGQTVRHTPAHRPAGRQRRRAHRGGAAGGGGRPVHGAAVVDRAAGANRSRRGRGRRPRRRRPGGQGRTRRDRVQCSGHRARDDRRGDLRRADDQAERAGIPGPPAERAVPRPVRRHPGRGVRVAGIR